MRIALILFQFLLFVLLVLFLVQNQGQFLDIHLFWLDTPRRVDSLAVMLLSFTIGGVLAWVLMTFYVINLRADLRKVRQQNRELMNELSNFRNLPLDEIPDAAVSDVPELPSPAARPE